MLIGRLATGLKKLPSEIYEMTLPDTLELLQYWDSFPPEHEMLEMFARAYTTWNPKVTKVLTEEEQQAAHQASLEARWKSGGAMNAAQILAAMGGAKSAAIDVDGMLQPIQMTGIGPLPGAN
jgi:hypothetical protein